jgi:hypothetical protein
VSQLHHKETQLIYLSHEEEDGDSDMILIIVGLTVLVVLMVLHVEEDLDMVCFLSPSPLSPKLDALETPYLHSSSQCLIVAYILCIRQIYYRP